MGIGGKGVGNVNSISVCLYKRVSGVYVGDLRMRFDLYGYIRY